MYETIHYEASDAVGTVFFNRPEKKNAYTPVMGEEIVAALNAAMADASVRVVILTGRGDAFCGGVDLDYLKAHMAGELPLDGPELGQEHFVNGWPLELVDYPKPVIAAINGAAYGVGVTMTLGCDVRYAEEGCTLGLNFTSLGLLPGLGSTHHLPRLIGMGKALEVVLSGGKFSAEEALQAGLVQRVCTAGSVYEEAKVLALRMAEKKPEVLAAARQSLRYGAGANLADAIANEKRRSVEVRGRRGD
ncbi:MAG: enoyl-CoA hydratase/isomerase family protein [Pseudomonadota bacterium]